MAAISKIEWTDASWNPIRARSRRIDPSGKERAGWHCEHVSEGCRNCYAETMNKRFGTGLEFKPGNRDGIELSLDEKMLLAPLSWRKPRMIFVCSMSDLFGDWVEDEWLNRMFAVMALCPQHTFQVLTKRPERMRLFIGDGNRQRASGMPPMGSASRKMHCRPPPMVTETLGLCLMVGLVCHVKIRKPQMRAHHFFVRYQRPFDFLPRSASGDRDQILHMYRLLAAERHPDKGGSNAAMAELNAARDAALKGPA